LYWGFIMYCTCNKGRRGHDHMVVGFTTTYVSVPITTNVVSSNPQGVLNITLYNKVC
jgi:hypothetical protein